MKLAVNEAKLTVLWARNCATVQQVLILTFAFGPEKLPGLSRNEPQGLFNFVSGFKRAYKLGGGGGGLKPGGLTTGLKKCFKTGYIAVLIKILFEYSRFFKLQYIVKY